MAHQKVHVTHVHTVREVSTGRHLLLRPAAAGALEKDLVDLTTEAGLYSSTAVLPAPATLSYWIKGLEASKFA